MSDILERDLVSYDPLSQVTRKERTALLGLSMLGLALVAVPLVPEKLGVFGIEFTKPNQATFLSLFAVLLLYYLAAFLIYAFTDLVAWQRGERIHHSEYTRAVDQRALVARSAPVDLDRVLVPAKPPTSKAHHNPVYRGIASFGIAVFASRLRALFEFGLPVLFSVYVIYRLFHASAQLGVGA